MLNSVNDGPHLAGPAAQEKSEQLERVLHSRALQNSESLRALLQYVGGRAIDGQDSQVKEYTIAVDVFGRNKDFNASTDSLVRVQAKRLRDKLKEYYESEGKADKVFIDLPKGHYTAVFSYLQHDEPPDETLDPESPEVSSPTAAVAPASAKPASGRLTVFLAAVVAVLLVFVGILFSYNRSLRKQVTEPAPAADLGYGLLWQPFLKSTAPTMLVLSNPPVYRFVNQMDPDVLVKNSLELTPPQSDWLAHSLGDRYLTRQELKFRLMLSSKEYTGVGEAIGLYQVAGLLRAAGKDCVFKQSRTVSAEDVKGNNIVLLGSVWSNVWSGKLPVKEDFSYTLNATIVNNNPQPGEQREYRPAFNEATGELTKDFALVTVRPGVTGDSVVMVLAGIESEGTQAAAEFVTRKEYLDELNRRLNQLSWGPASQKYYQVLLEADVDNGIPTTISILSIHPLEAARKN
jgi:hypothetical protein